MKPHLIRATVIVAGLSLAGTVSAGEAVKLGLNGLSSGAVPKGTMERLATLDVDHRSATFGQISDIRFNGKTTLDRGLDVGFMAEFHFDAGVCAGAPSSCAGQSIVDEVYISVSGQLGKVGVGANGTVTEEMSYLAPLVTKFTRVSDSALVFPAQRPAAPLAAARETRAAFAPNLTYLTPRYGGLQFGVTLTQREPLLATELNLGILMPRDLRGRWPMANALGLDANYAHAFNRVTVKLGGTYVASHDEPVPVPLLDTTLRWGAGGELNYALPRGRGALALTGSVRDLSSAMFAGGPLLDGGDSAVWDAGLRYTKGPLSLGGYTIAGKAYAAQAGYRLSPGVQIGGGVQFWNYQLQGDLLPGGLDSRTGDTHSTVVFIETALDF